MSDEHDPDQYVELFHELRTDAPGGKRAPSIRSTFGIVAGLVVGFGLIIWMVVLWGERTEEAQGPVSRPNIFVCAGERATITGTDEDDVIDGTPRRDIIHARRGNDIVRASGGDDIVCGGHGDDELRGGRGNDDLRGEDGNDVCVGGPGDDDRFETCETIEE